MFTLALSLYTGICNMYWAGADTRTRCLSCVIKLHRQQSDQRGFSTETQLVMTMCLHLSRPLWLLPSSRIFTTQEKTTCCTQLFLSQCLHLFRQREAFLKPQKTSATRDTQFVSTPALIVPPPPFPELFSAQFQTPVWGESTEILNTAQEGNNKVVTCICNDSQFSARRSSIP